MKASVSLFGSGENLFTKKADVFWDFIAITNNNILKHVTSLRVKVTGAISQSAYADEMHHAFDPKISLLSVIGE